MVKNRIKKTSIGASGIQLNSGVFLKEYLSDLKFSGNAFNNLDKMRRSDYEIARILRVINTPILSAKYEFNPLDPSDPKQVDQSNFKSSVIKKWMKKTWNESLQDVLSYLVFGFSVFEPVFHVVDDEEFGLVQTLSTFGFRSQNTIKEWHIKNDGGLDYIIQNISGTDFDREVKIPGSELLIFTNDLEGNNLEGVSILRSAWGPYTRKKLYEKIDMIGIEKMAIGTPLAYIPQGIESDSEEARQIAAVLRSYTAHQNQYILLPEVMKGNFEIVRGEYSSDAVRASIRDENINITKSVVASFLDIGTLQRGGDRQTDALIDIFLTTIQGIGDYICQKLDPLVHSIYVMNYGEPAVRLRLKCSNITKKNLPGMADIIQKLVSSGVIHSDDSLEHKLRQDLDLPEASSKKDDPKPDIKKQTPESTVSPKEKTDAEKPTGENLSHCDATESHLSQNRELTKFEKRIDIDSIRKSFDEGETAFKSIIRGGFDSMRSKYLADLKTALKQENKTRAISSIKIGFTAQIEKDIRSFLRELVRIGSYQMSQEIGISQKLDETDGVPNGVKSRILITAQSIANDVSEKVLNASFTALDAIDSGLSDEDVVKKTDEKLSSILSTSSLYTATGAVVNKFLNIGRNTVGFSNKNLVQGFQFSAVLDSATTDICRSLDSQTFSVEDAQSLWLRPPLHWGCRSILVPILASEDVDSFDGLKPSTIEKNGRSIPVDEVLKSKTFLNEPDYNALPVGHVVERNGKRYVRDFDGKFRLA